MNTVTRLNWQGDVVGSYSGMSESKGMSLSDDGTVYVCDYGRNVIQEISGDCSTGKVVLKDLKNPYAVCWCEETKKLYSSAAEQNFLHTYKLS
jgi:hypothetical protein